MALIRTSLNYYSRRHHFNQLRYFFDSTYSTASSTSRSRLLFQFLHGKSTNCVQAQTHNFKTITGMAAVMNLEESSQEMGAITDAKTEYASVTQKIVTPPMRKGMTILDKTAFEKEISVPTILIPQEKLKNLLPKLKPFLLKIKNLPNVFLIDGTDQKKVLFDPDKVTNVEELLKDVAGDLNEVKNSLSPETIKFTYDHWSIHQIMQSILPDDQEKFSGFSITGHVIHVNLRDHLLRYKNIIGQVLLDKVPYAKTIVNKLEQIENKYRNFPMEIIAGESNTVVKMKENKCEFEFDFATVYWNSRLSTEHENIVKLLKRRFVVFDVFAGVGPFAIPAAKKKCFVLANDLNPESARWLKVNVEKNKVADFVQVYNKDGREFLHEDVSKYLKEQMTKQDDDSLEYHVIMNLPAIAVEFLDAFWNLLDDTIIPSHFELKVHVYCFIKDAENYKDQALQLVKDKLKYDLSSDNVIEVAFVRNVAPNKEMLRVSFKVPHQVLGNLSCSSNVQSPREQLKRKHNDTD